MNNWVALPDGIGIRGPLKPSWPSLIVGSSRNGVSGVFSIQAIHVMSTVRTL